MNRNTSAIFWIAVAFYVLCPLTFALLGTSALSYRPAEHERFLSGTHEPLETEQRCRFDDCDEVPIAWRDRKTGEVYREVDFREHRSEERKRLAASWFIYGVGGCLLAGWFRQRFHGEPLAGNIATYLLGNAVLVGIILWMLPA